MLTCDGAMTVYVDGVKINNKTSDLEVAQNSTIPKGSTILAIHCRNPVKPPRILGSINVSMVTSSKDWVCTNRYHRAWNTTQFVDTSWAPSVDFGSNEAIIPYGKVANISNTAEWIAVKNNTGDLYCRVFLCPQNGKDACALTIYH
jgi:hypothetical protein